MGYEAVQSTVQIWVTQYKHKKEKFNNAEQAERSSGIWGCIECETKLCYSQNATQLRMAESSSWLVKRQKVETPNWKLKEDQEVGWPQLLYACINTSDIHQADWEKLRDKDLGFRLYTDIYIHMQH